MFTELLWVLGGEETEGGRAIRGRLHGFIVTQENQCRPAAPPLLELPTVCAASSQRGARGAVPGPAAGASEPRVPPTARVSSARPGARTPRARHLSGLPRM